VKIGVDQLPAPGVKIGEYEYFTAHQIAAAVGVPAYHIIARAREGAFPGRKIGKVYLIPAHDFYRWVRDGRFEFNPRASRARSLAEERELASEREEERLKHG
jgi:hypothetical protein